MDNYLDNQIQSLKSVLEYKKKEIEILEEKIAELEAQLIASNPPQ